MGISTLETLNSWLREGFQSTRGFSENEHIQGALTKFVNQGLPNGRKHLLRALKHSGNAPFQSMGGDALMTA